MQTELLNKARFYLNFLIKISKLNILKLYNMDVFALNTIHMVED